MEDQENRKRHYRLGDLDSVDKIGNRVFIQVRVNDSEFKEMVTTLKQMDVYLQAMETVNKNIESLTRKFETLLCKSISAS